MKLETTVAAKRRPELKAKRAATHELRAGNFQALLDAFQPFGELIQANLLLHDLVVVVRRVPADSSDASFQAGDPVLDFTQFVFYAFLASAHSTKVFQNQIFYIFAHGASFG
jgi:hypothetical protein